MMPMTGFCTRHTTRHSAGTALIRGLCLLALLLPGLTVAVQRPLEVIDFQLRWKHQFQFAGYYAAIAQGYYREEGLDVRLHEGAPVVIASGRTPSTKASEVMMIGRSRIRMASSVALTRSMPDAWRSFANSTIRIAFFAERPTVVSRPTWKYTSLARPRILVARIAPMTPSGTTSMTENGIDQLSYSAARHRNTTISEMAYSAGACEPVRRSWKDNPVHS